MEGLTVAELLDQARAETELSDFGGDTFLPGLEALTSSLERDARLSDVGRIAMPLQLTRMLANRLEVHDWTTRHPEILDEPIAPPLFVVGLPRTGTTLLSFLLAQDPRSRSLLQWEATRPCPPPDRATLATDPRRQETAESLAALDAVVPEFKAIHTQEADGPTECVTLLAHEFASIHFETLASIPSYGDWLLEHDMTAAYAYHRQLLQLLQWRNPAARWVLKSPAHLSALDAVTATYPGARFVWTHRDPAAVVASTCSLVSVLHRVASDDIRPLEAGAYWPDRLAGMVEAGMAYRDRNGGGAFLDLPYSELVGDPLGAVRGIYEFADWELTAAAEDQMASWMAANPQDKHGRHAYELTDFGIEAAAVRDRFAPYCRRFLPALDSTPRNA